MTSGWYETPFRNYDPVLGRFMSVDPMATKYAPYCSYHYSYNNPVMFNDPSGADGYGPSGPELPEYTFAPPGYTDNNGDWHWNDPDGDAQAYADLGMGQLYSTYREQALQWEISKARSGDRDALTE